ncbi:unnamed protein product [Pleuronectes platessa]|uniref:Uncharacterized protein n=1 Tax=Pleuronectes platessa TaxID=8262 RepID=A0A9N7YW04_PLEPL|nr:unnamed protein product [Pleuronectes platessa]
MAMAILAMAPPSYRLVGDVVCDEVLPTAGAICQHMTAGSQLPFISHERGYGHVGARSGKAFAVSRMDICTVGMKSLYEDGTWWQQTKPSVAEILPPGHNPQLLLGEPEEFPDQMGCKTPTACSGSAPGSRPGWLCPE